MKLVVGYWRYNKVDYSKIVYLNLYCYNSCFLDVYYEG